VEAPSCHSDRVRGGRVDRAVRHRAPDRDDASTCCGGERLGCWDEHHDALRRKCSCQGCRHPRRGPDWGRLAAYAILILITIAYLGPMLMLVLTAFKTLPSSRRTRRRCRPPSASTTSSRPGTRQLPALPADTVIYTIASTVVFVVSGTFLALAIARRFVRGPGRSSLCSSSRCSCRRR